MRTRTALAAAASLVATACTAPAAQQAPAAYDAPRAPALVEEAPSPVAAPRVLDRARRSTTDPASPWVVVNKRHPLRPDFRPELGLVRGYQVAHAAVGPLTRLLDDGDARGLGLKIASAFRSHAYQAHVYANAVAARGTEAADRVSARPGHSEHQTGLAVDLVTPATPDCDLERCFAATPAGRWLGRSAWRYGFLVRYQPGSTAVTGYAPEPWHLRFVGRDLAAELRRTGTATLEEYFGVPGGDYP